MTTDYRTALARIKDFEQLIDFLRDELAWPLEGHSFDDITFEYTPAELGIDEINAATIQDIKRLRPIALNQPWGIFFIEFEPKRLPVLALRRILGKVTHKKRASANSAERQSWAVEDLLFVTNYGEEASRKISLAHFSIPRDEGRLPTLRVLGWDNRDTALHLDAVSKELTENLAWPEDESNTEAWRQKWRAAFKLQHREVITTSRDLSVRLAELARDIRDRIQTALEIETKDGRLSSTMKAFKEVLVHDLDSIRFAGMYAQTIAYGLLSAHIANPTRGTSDDFARHMRTNPFLRDLMETFFRVGQTQSHVSGVGIDFDELGVAEVMELLDNANIEAILQDFGDRNPREDPVIHFYELFLKEYDPNERMRRGVFYTPRPVVSYLVRSVDELLRTEFGLADGLADTTSWGEMVKRQEHLRIPEGVPPSQDFIQILDPAVGTGTFLVEAIDLIYKTLRGKWTDQGCNVTKIDTLWNDYVSQHLLTRLHGYELLMAPYAIAHLKIGLKLYETGYRFDGNERARVFLTNSLGQPQDYAGHFEVTIPELAHEAVAVNRIKRTQRFTVIIGNPPYANYSAHLTEAARRLVDKYRSFHGIPIKERNQLQFERNIQDDYVKFISAAQDTLSATGCGILSFITNGTMLASKSLRGMRESLVTQFSSLYELNLHGGLNEIVVCEEPDENVFDISQSVAVHLYCQSKSDGTTVVNYADVVGRRESKYAWLESHSVERTNWKTIHPDYENCSFLLQHLDETLAICRLDSLFVQYGAGLKTNRDSVVIAFDDESLCNSVREYDENLTDRHDTKSYIQSLLYRPFDLRRIFYHKNTVASRSWPTMKHVIRGPNIGILACSTWTSPDRFSVGVSRLMVEMKTGTHDRGTTFFPIYRYDSLLEEENEQVHNFTQEFIEMWCATTRTEFIPTGRGDGRNWTGPEDVLSWLFGLFNSPSYRHRYRSALSQGFPSILMTSNLEFMREMIRLGSELIDLHLMESQKLDDIVVNYFGSRSPMVSTVGWSNGTVWLDAGETKSRQGFRATVPGTVGFECVPEKVWDFYIGGYQVGPKWLNGRKGRVLSNSEIIHFQKILVILAETIRFMDEIDETIEDFGGWPDAFH